MEKRAWKNQKFAGFPRYSRTDTALDSSSLELKTCSQEAAAQAKTNQSGDFREGNQGLAFGHLPGLEDWAQQERLDLLRYVERTLRKDQIRQEPFGRNFEDLQHLELVSSLDSQPPLHAK